MTRLWMLLFVLALTACGSSRNSDRTDEKNADMVASLIEAIAGAAAAAGDDCGKMATELEAVFVKHESGKPSLKEWFAELDKDDARMVAFAERVARRVEPLRPQLVAIEKCKDDPRMKEADARIKRLTKGE